MRDVELRPFHALLLRTERDEHDRPLERNARGRKRLRRTQQHRYAGRVVVRTRHQHGVQPEVVEVRADDDRLLLEHRVSPLDEADNVRPDPFRVMLGDVFHRHHLARSERGRFERRSNLLQNVVALLARAGEHVVPHGAAGGRPAEALHEGAVRIDDEVVVDHAGGAVLRGVLHLVVVERIGPPLLEELGVAVGRDRHLRFHHHQLAFHVDAGVVVVAEFGRGGAIADVDDLGGNGAGVGGRTREVLLLEDVRALHDLAVRQLDVEAERTAREHERVGIRELLVERPLVAGRLDLPPSHEVGRPLRDRVELWRARQPALVFRRCHLFHVVEQRMARNTVHVRHQAVFAQRIGGRGLTRLLGDDQAGQEEDGE